MYQLPVIFNGYQVISNQFICHSVGSVDSKGHSTSKISQGVRYRGYILCNILFDKDLHLQRVCLSQKVTADHEFSTGVAKLPQFPHLVYISPELTLSIFIVLKNIYSNIFYICVQKCYILLLTYDVYNASLLKKY